MLANPLHHIPCEFQRKYPTVFSGVKSSFHGKHLPRHFENHDENFGMPVNPDSKSDAPNPQNLQGKHAWNVVLPGVQFCNLILKFSAVLLRDQLTTPVRAQLMRLWTA